MFKTSVFATFFVSITSGLIWGPAAFLAALGLLATGLLALTWREAALVEIEELAAAPVFRRRGRRFSRFLPAGRHWINPLRERVGPAFSTAGRSTTGQCVDAQTAGGVPVTVDWAVHYQINPSRIRGTSAARLARVLPDKAENLVRQHTNHLLYRLLGTVPLEELLATGVHGRLERALRLQLRGRLEVSGLQISRVMIASIHKPRQVLDSLEAAHEKALQAEIEARALERLQQVISRFSNEDVRHLLELERIHALGRQGTVLLQPAAIFDGHAQRPVTRCSGPPLSVSFNPPGRRV